MVVLCHLCRVAVDPRPVPVQTRTWSRANPFLVPAPPSEDLLPGAALALASSKRRCERGTRHVPATRIVLIDLGPDLASRLRAASADIDDLVVVGEEAEEVPLLVRAAEADVVIIGRSDEAAAAMAERLIDENPALAVVALDPTAERARIHRLRLSVEDVTVGDAAELVDVVRRLGAESPPWTSDISTPSTPTPRERT